MRSFAILVFTAVLVGGLAAAAAAQAAGEEIRGTLESINGTERTLIEGATVVVSQDGAVVGSAVSDEDGLWSVPVSGPGTYQVELDLATLPEGVSPTRAGAESLPNVQVRAGQSKGAR